MVNKIVAFDLDGTLIDSAPDIASALNEILIKNHLEPVSLEKVRHLIGNGARALIHDAFSTQNIKIKNLNSLTEDFLFVYKQCFKDKTILFENVVTVLKELKNSNIKLLLVSNKPQFYVKELLSHFVIQSFFSFFSGGDTFIFRKPDPRHIYESISSAGISGNSRGIFVGDSKFDYECAKNAMWPCILFSKGYSDVDIKKLEPYKIFDNYKQLPSIIYNTFEKYTFSK